MSLDPSDKIIGDVASWFNLSWSDARAHILCYPEKFTPEAWPMHPAYGDVERTNAQAG